MDEYQKGWKKLRNKRILATFSWLGLPLVVMLLNFVSSIISKIFAGNEIDIGPLGVFWIILFFYSRHAYNNYKCPRCKERFFKYTNLRSNCSNCNLHIGDSAATAHELVKDPKPIYKSTDWQFFENRLFWSVMLIGSFLTTIHSVIILLDPAATIMVNGEPVTDLSVKLVTLLIWGGVSIFGVCAAIFPIKIMTFLFSESDIEVS